MRRWRQMAATLKLLRRCITAPWLQPRCAAANAAAVRCRRFRADDAAVGLTARLRGGVKRKQKKEQRLVLGRRADQLSLELDAVLTAVLWGQLCWRMTRWGCQVSCCGCWSFGRSPRD